MSFTVLLVKAENKLVFAGLPSTKRLCCKLIEHSYCSAAVCTCTDPSSRCIMAAITFTPPATTWSSCSVSYLNEGYRNNLDRCLFNTPQRTLEDPVCGNGIREGNETCDCGSVEVKLSLPHTCSASGGKVIGVGVHIYICLWAKKKFVFSDRLTFSNIHGRTSRQTYRLALPLLSPETLSSLSKSRIFL